jgi:hypothetical protein
MTLHSSFRMGNTSAICWSRPFLPLGWPTFSVRIRRSGSFSFERAIRTVSSRPFSVSRKAGQLNLGTKTLNSFALLALNWAIKKSWHSRLGRSRAIRPLRDCVCCLNLRAMLSQKSNFAVYIFVKYNGMNLMFCRLKLFKQLFHISH